MAWQETQREWEPLIIETPRLGQRAAAVLWRIACTCGERFELPTDIEGSCPTCGTRYFVRPRVFTNSPMVQEVVGRQHPSMDDLPDEDVQAAFQFADSPWEYDTETQGLYDSFGELIATVEPYMVELEVPGHTWTVTELANGRLMAAAPELYWEVAGALDLLRSLRRLVVTEEGPLQTIRSKEQQLQAVLNLADGYVVDAAKEE